MAASRSMSLEEFDQLFESLKNWGRWGPDDEMGTLNYLTPDKVRTASTLVKRGRSASMAISVNTVAGPGNPNPVIHYMSTTQDIDAGSGDYLRFAPTSSARSFRATATRTSTRCAISPTEDNCIMVVRPVSSPRAVRLDTTSRPMRMGLSAEASHRHAALAGCEAAGAGGGRDARGD